MRRTALLFRSLWTFHRRGVLLAGLLLAGGLGLTAHFASGSPTPADDEPERLILDRLWIDQIPEEGTDPIHVEFWLPGGLAVMQHGTPFRYLTEAAEFERSGDRLRGRYLQDGEEFRARFRVTRCDDAPPFDLCLHKRGTHREPHVLHGFSDSAAEARHIPASLRAMAAAHR